MTVAVFAAMALTHNPMAAMTTARTGQLRMTATLATVANKLPACIFLVTFKALRHDEHCFEWYFHGSISSLRDI
jgi:hypothetical protein